MSNLCLIPARGGSKRIPRKNIKEFAGLPMIAHSIKAALACEAIDRVVVTTDDQEIAEIARAHGAETPFIRPAELANDHAATVPVVAHAIQTLHDSGAAFEYVCCLYATAPFATSAWLTDGLSKLKSRPQASYAFTVAEFPSAVQRALRIRQDGTLESLYPEFALTRTQDLEPSFYDAGQFYWGRSEAWLAEMTIHGPHAVPLILASGGVVDIDTPDDWIRAELLYKVLKQGDPT